RGIPRQAPMPPTSAAPDSQTRSATLRSRPARTERPPHALGSLSLAGWSLPFALGEFLETKLPSGTPRTPAQADSGQLLLIEVRADYLGRGRRRFHCAPTCGACAVGIRDRHSTHTGGRSPDPFPDRRPWHTGGAGGRVLLAG